MSIFTALGARVQWVIYRKADKVPVHPEKLYAIDAQEPANWLRGDVAVTWAKFLGPEYGPGIVLWRGCGIACIDIDKALQNGQWSLLAQELCARFKGAYQEISQGGAGVHILYSYRNEMQPHRKRNTALHLEMYDELRFIGITETNCEGDVSFDATHLLPQLIADYFAPDVSATAGGWTTESAEGWDGPEDDDELIRRMCAARDAGAIFGGKASLADLWNANADALALAFPPQSEGKDYDGSSADQALANHLAFWAGANCERMHRLMQRSGLKRNKWDREDYLNGTILKAASWQKTFYKQRTISQNLPAPVGEMPIAPIAPGDTRSDTPIPAPGAALPETRHGTIIGVPGQLLIFEGCQYVQDINQIMVPSGLTLKREQFDNSEAFAGRRYLAAVEGAPNTSAWDTYTQSQLALFPRVRGTFFDPRKPEDAVEERAGHKYVNTWRDPKVEAIPGDVSLYTAHISKLFPKGEDALIYISYVAACVQNLGHKAAWALFIQGAPGNGKSFMTKVIKYCIGKDYVHSATASNLDNRFNGYLYRKLMILVEEVKTTEGQAGTWEKLKTMITEDHQEIEGKGVDQVTREVCFNMMFNSNHKDGLRKTKDDRRLCTLFAAQQTAEDLIRDGMGEDYFNELFGWAEGGGYARILHFLRAFQIPERYDFARGCHRAPTTSATAEAIAAGLGGIEQDILDAVESNDAGFRGGWISSGALDIMLSKHARGKHVGRAKRKEILAGLGYIPHPKLPNGRLTNPLAGGDRPTLYIKSDHSAVHAPDVGLVKHMYEIAQAKE